MTRLKHLTLAAAAIAVTVSGCHRQFYRRQADQEVQQLIDEKSSHVARPPNVGYDVNVDRRSRMFNPFDLDFQPMPLDDPASYRYMQCVDGRRGYPMWEAAGLTNTAESPDWWQFLPLDDDGVLVLNSENAVRIALLHSPEYQQRVEALYFAALAVSNQRFQFDTNFFGGLGASQVSRLNRPPQYTLGSSNLELRRNLAWGGSLIAGVANNIVWEFDGTNRRVGTTLFDFALLQPLLRNAGRDVVLEGLTQAERNLLAEVRAFERFRRSFYLQITTGRGSGFTAPGIAQLNANVSLGAGGFLGLLQNRLQIRNQEENIARQSELLLLNESTLIELLTVIPDRPDEIIQQRIQVAQSRQSLLDAQSRLIRSQANFQASVDSFLRDLGLPPYICVRLDDPILDRFELVDRELLQRREQLTQLRTKVGAYNVQILGMAESVVDPVTNIPERQLGWTDEVRELIAQLRKELEPLREFNLRLVEEDLALIAKDIAKLEASVPFREERNDDLLELYRREQQGICGLVGVQNVDESLFNLEQLIELSGELKSDYSNLEQKFAGYLERIETLDATFERLMTEGPRNADPSQVAIELRDEVILYSQDLLASLGEDVLSLQLIQAQARTESVLLPEVDIEPPVAFEIARRNRRDWANARAALVDAWRQIEVVADDLESVLDLEVNGALTANSEEPDFGLRNNGSLRVGLVWDAPLTRLLERNNYRRTLIEYEQTRRLYYSYEDSIWQLLRGELRQLQASRYTFEIARRAVRAAAAQTELNSDRRQLAEAQGQGSGPTAARDAIQAVNDLLGAQNDLLDIFVGYEVVRRSLDLDLGTMELTPEGLWIDPGVIAPETLVDRAGTMVDGMIEYGCTECGIRYNPLPPQPMFSDVLGDIQSAGPVEMEIPVVPEPVRDPNQLDSGDETVQEAAEAFVPGSGAIKPDSGGEPLPAPQQPPPSQVLPEPLPPPGTPELPAEPESPSDPLSKRRLDHETELLPPASTPPEIATRPKTGGAIEL